MIAFIFGPIWRSFIALLGIIKLMPVRYRLWVSHRSKCTTCMKSFNELEIGSTVWIEDGAGIILCPQCADEQIGQINLSNSYPKI